MNKNVKPLLLVLSCSILSLTCCLSGNNSSSISSSESISTTSSTYSASTSDSECLSCMTGYSDSSFIPDYPWESYEKTSHNWVDERDAYYRNFLAKPSTLVHNFNELMAITDFYAFYKVEKYNIDIAEDYEFGCGYRDWNKELVYLYDVGELYNGVAGFKGSVKDNILTMNVDVYRNAYIETKPKYKVLNDAIYFETKNLRDISYNSFATEDINKPVVDVYTTQQLWYAAEQGYRINPLIASNAEYYYEHCKTILRNICSDEMTDLEKYTAIFKYVIHHATYDFAAAYDIDDPVDPDNYPDSVCSGYKAYFIEGFFDNGLIVCDGFAKIITLLGRMEGLDIVRASGMNDSDFLTKDTSGHAYNYINIDNKSYLSDATWCQKQLRVNGETCMVYTYGNFLTGTSDHEQFIQIDIPNYPIPEKVNSFDLYYTNNTIDNYEPKTKINVSLNDVEDINRLANILSNSYGSCLEIMFDSADARNLFESKLTATTIGRSLSDITNKYTVAIYTNY